MSWEDQGRQDHGWFGHGTAPKQDKAAAEAAHRFHAGGLGARIEAVAQGAIGALPAALRGRAEAQFGAGNLSKLTGPMAAWNEGALLPGPEFAERFFGRAPDDPVVRDLHAAAVGAAAVSNHADLQAAAQHLAQAVQAVGLDRWPRFLAEAETRANDPATRSAAATSQRLAQLRQDAIRPVYPVETLLGIAAGGLAGRAVGAGREAMSAIVRQVRPEEKPATTAEPQAPADRSDSTKLTEQVSSPTATLDIVAPAGKPVGYIERGAGPEVRTVSPSEFEIIKGKLLEGAEPGNLAGYDGKWYIRQDGFQFGLRTSRRSGETIDVRHPDLNPAFKVHKK